MRRAFALLILLATPVAAQGPLVVSSAPDRVDVTLYRDPNRGAGEYIDFKQNDPDEWDDEPLGGFALVNETRTVDLPPGEVTIRFEGVASGIVPQSALLFDTDLAEKNFDSRLMSQRGLIDAYTGQRVTIRRTDRATGTASIEPGTILSRPDGLVLRTAHGLEAVQCEGSINTVLFPGKPLDLTAKPTLSLTTRPDQPGGRLTLKLAYIAGNFDWQANYVGTFSPDGQSLRLMAWMTLASHDRTSFTEARTSAVAGTVFLNKPTDEEQEAAEEERENDPYATDNIGVSSGCWPMQRTSGSTSQGPLFGPGALPVLEAPIAVRLTGGGDWGGGGGGGCYSDEETGDEVCDDQIVVTASRIVREELGDLKLYAVQRPTTVAAQSMKQVRLFAEREVKGELLYRVKCGGDGTSCNDPELLFRFTNDDDSGLGEPLPKGEIALFQQTARGRQMLGETSLEDRTTDEEVDVVLPDGNAEAVDVETDELDRGEVNDEIDWTKQQLTLTNDGEVPVVVEVELRGSDRYALSRLSPSTFERKGARVWRVKLPPEGTRKLTFRSTEVPEIEEE